MAFDPETFYHFSVWIVEKNPDEASLRTAISRVYFAAHLIALQKMIDKNWLQPKGSGDDHGAVISQLKLRRRTQGDRLVHLLTLRQHVDYHMDTAQMPWNEKCEHCKKQRESSPTQPGVVLSHWLDAKEVSDHLLPLLKKL